MSSMVVSVKEKHRFRGRGLPNRSEALDVALGFRTGIGATANVADEDIAVVRGSNAARILNEVGLLDVGIHRSRLLLWSCLGLL